MYLVDTNVVSAGAPAKAAVPVLLAWMEQNSADLYLSVVSVAEIVGGVEKLRRQGATRRAEDLEAWLDTVLHLYGERVLSFEAAAARVAGVLTDLVRGKGQAPGFADTVIAATAAVRGFTVLTRSLRHFEPFGIAAVDPFESLPPGRT